MGRRCCIAGCTSTSRLSEHKGVTYHSFPSDTVIRDIWMRNARVNPERQITKSVLVCSRHFRRIDFQPQRSGKYLLKQRVFPTCFPWGKIDAAQVEADLAELRQNQVSNANSGAVQQTAAAAAASSSSASTAPLTASEDNASKEIVEAKVAQIMAETANLSAKTNVGAQQEKSMQDAGATTEDDAAVNADSSSGNNRFRPITNFSPGVRLEAKDHQGIWHAARIVEVDNVEREVLIRLERSGKSISKSAQSGGQEEWILMNSNRLRQRMPKRPVPKFEQNEKCMARWSGPRKFPGIISKVLGNDAYEVLFDDGYVKNVRAVHMSKMPAIKTEAAAIEPAAAVMPTVVPLVPTLPVVKQELPAAVPATHTSSGRKKAPPPRKDWPLLDVTKLDLASLNLPEVPRDGEWTCHWVNDQPIGKEGFLIVGEHRKPTVIVEDWRLPPGWVKHMYQRSNVLGKWDVILVTPANKRFRSKSDLKTHLEEQGIHYNPDVYDFSIHRRRAKDIGAYVFTPDYTPPQAQKAHATTAGSSLNASLALPELGATRNSTFLEAPIATATPPMELMTVPGEAGTSTLPLTVSAYSPAMAGVGADTVKMENGHIYIGELKIQIVDNLFRCPQEGCLKNFRKENHVQIHIKHYHPELSKKLGSCPKMMELAEKRTHTTTVVDTHEPQPKNQIPNQEFFAKLYQQDQLQMRQRKTGSILSPVATNDLIKMETIKTEQVEVANVSLATTEANSTFNSTMFTDQTPSTSTAEESQFTPVLSAKRSRFSPTKRSSGSRRSNRQRTTRRFLTTHAVRNRSNVNANTSLANVRAADFEDTRHSFTATPDVKLAGDIKKSRSNVLEPMSSIESPITADSGSSSYPPLKTPSSNDAEQENNNEVQYIKENGQLIKIVRMRQEEIINCVCNYFEENGLMIQCDLCLCWQHSICNGFNSESDVPDKYICYICQHPERGREAHRFKHDQDWLFDGKLATANYHLPNPNLSKQCEFLKQTHTLTGNLLELKQVLHSLRVKKNIASNRAHPKLYLWAKKWDEPSNVKTEAKQEMHQVASDGAVGHAASSTHTTQAEQLVSNGPQPEAPIEPVECQARLLEHIKVQQDLVWNRLLELEAAVDELERQDDLQDLKDDDMSATKDTVAAVLKDLEVMSKIARLNAYENEKKAAEELQQ